MILFLFDISSNLFDSLMVASMKEDLFFMKSEEGLVILFVIDSFSAALRYLLIVSAFIDRHFRVCPRARVIV